MSGTRRLGSGQQPGICCPGDRRLVPIETPPLPLLPPPLHPGFPQPYCESAANSHSPSPAHAALRKVKGDLKSSGSKGAYTDIWEVCKSWGKKVTWSPFLQVTPLALQSVFFCCGGVFCLVGWLGGFLFVCLDSFKGLFSIFFLYSCIWLEDYACSCP